MTARLDLDVVRTEWAEAAEHVQQHWDCCRGHEIAHRIPELINAVMRLRTDIAAVRTLCNSYTPEPPPIFRGPGLSEHGLGFNHGTRTLAQAVLSTLDGEPGESE